MTDTGQKISWRVFLRYGEYTLNVIVELLCVKFDYMQLSVLNSVEINIAFQFYL